MIELFASDTPNGKKISIMLEEINLPYKVVPVDLSKGEQFEEKFVKISPFSKIPVIRDSERTTAEEVRMTAQELQDSLGGIYGVLSQEFHYLRTHIKYCSAVREFDRRSVL